jgi:hypothetical protein
VFASLLKYPAMLTAIVKGFDVLEVRESRHVSYLLGIELFSLFV